MLSVYSTPRRFRFAFASIATCSIGDVLLEWFSGTDYSTKPLADSIYCVQIDLSYTYLPVFKSYVELPGRFFNVIMAASHIVIGPENVVN